MGNRCGDVLLVHVCAQMENERFTLTRTVLGGCPRFIDAVRAHVAVQHGDAAGSSGVQVAFAAAAGCQREHDRGGPDDVVH